MNQTFTQTKIDSINFSNVDFDRLDEVNECARTICNAASNSGMFSENYRSAGTFGDIRRWAKKWLQEIDRRLNDLSPGEALQAIAYYDIIHRIGFCIPAYPETINKHVLRAFEAYIGGDRSIDEYDLFHYISLGLKRRDTAYFDRPLQWHSICLDRWYKQFRHGVCLEKLSDYDIRRRVNALLESDLRAYTPNQTTFKQTLRSHNQQDNITIR